ncbi:hypothetical protein [Noviherbaspirillum sp.]|uniref:hypothetical protein n=1 Tax=Noviherbaspirillum sp. TaxID=1926288 RepID=UPI002FE1188E
MSALFPDTPFIPTPSQLAVPVREQVIPAHAARHRDYFRTCKALPPGMPDCLSVSIAHSVDGTERSTAAIYGGHAYLIHYEFTPRP